MIISFLRLSIGYIKNDLYILHCNFSSYYGVMFNISGMFMYYKLIYISVVFVIYFHENTKNVLWWCLVVKLRSQLQYRVKVH